MIPISYRRVHFGVHSVGQGDGDMSARLSQDQNYQIIIRLEKQQCLTYSVHFIDVAHTKFCSLISIDPLLFW